LNEQQLEELRELLNKHSREGQSNTPDFLLRDFIVGCLEAFEKTVRQREAWYGRTTEEPGDPPPHIRARVGGGFR